MTQDIEPLDYVKRTNIEEHKQFHDKINEIVENLAPTVDRADQLLQQVGEQSTQVADAVTNANTASTQAQAAAAVAQGLGDRVTAVENSAAQNHSDITVLDGEVTDINNDLTNVVRKVTNDVQKVNKGLRVGEVPAGDDVVVSRKVLQELLDAYESMVRTTGDQAISGLKSRKIGGNSSASGGATTPFFMSTQSTGFEVGENQDATRHYPIASLVDVNAVPVAKLAVSTSNDSISVYIVATLKNGTVSTRSLGTMNRTTGVWS